MCKIVKFTRLLQDLLVSRLLCTQKHHNVRSVVSDVCLFVSFRGFREKFYST